jgi:DNA-binding transcriptional MerR regulator
VAANNIDSDAPESPASAEAWPPDTSFTIDELASISGVPSRTIRFYQSKGTLSAPERRGRVAFYSPEHVERLRLIGELQDRGLRLDAIRDALDQIEKGAKSLQSWLGMGDELQAPWIDDGPLVVTEAELLERFGHHPGVVGEMRRLGFIERQGNTRPATYLLPSSALVDIAAELVRAGIDIELAVGASELMRGAVGSLADDLVKYFSSHTGEGFGGSGRPEQILQAYDSLRPQALRAIQVIFALEIQRAMRVFVEGGGTIPPARDRPT